MKFKYYKSTSHSLSDFFGLGILRPIIPIRIVGQNNAIKYNVLVDSGADFCIFDAEIGEYLGINVRSGTEITFGGIQSLGGAKAYIHRINMEVGGHPFRAEVGFSYDIAKSGHGILGQKGFFDLFIVKFDLQKTEIEIKPRSAL